MAGQVLSLNSTSNTAAAFRAWGSAISGGFAAAGLVKTADTGQIDWATATPGAINTAVGYEIWRFNDALQATRPILLKMEYGVGPSNSPGMWLTVGTASDGAGLLTSLPGYGTTVTARIFLPNSSVTGLTANTISNSYIANADGSAIGGMFWPSNNSAHGGWMFAIERTRDLDTGAPNGDGFYILYANSVSSGIVRQQQFVFTTGYAQQSPAQAYIYVPYAWGMPAGLPQTIGNTLYPLPLFTGVTPKLQGPSKLIVALKRGDLAAHTQFPLTVYGETNTFVAAGIGATPDLGWGNWAFNAQTPSPDSYAMRIS